MKYTKPEVVMVGVALETVQSNEKVALLTCDGIPFINTIGAYEADE